MQEATTLGVGIVEVVNGKTHTLRNPSRTYTAFLFIDLNCIYGIWEFLVFGLLTAPVDGNAWCMAGFCFPSHVYSCKNCILHTRKRSAR
jgi:hypothetical protein